MNRWFTEQVDADESGRVKHWSPVFRQRNGDDSVLNELFDTKEDCERFIHEELMGSLRVFALIDDNGVVWWRDDNDPDVYECSVGDRRMHIDEYRSDTDGKD